MKTPLTFALLLLASSALAQQPTPVPVPEALKPAFAILTSTYPKLDAQKRPRPPADSAWLFRSALGGSGTVEVGFQGTDVVYMVFRRGVGGGRWTAAEIEGIHRHYSASLLKEFRFGRSYQHIPDDDGETHDLSRLRYGDGRIGNKGGTTANNTAFIARKDFDIATLMTGL